MYFYGAASPADNPELYRSYVERLAALLEEQAAASLEVSPCPLANVFMVPNGRCYRFCDPQSQTPAQRWVLTAPSNVHTAGQVSGHGHQHHGLDRGPGL